MYFLLFRQYMDEEWSERWAPNATKMDTLLREGAPRRKKFVAWFMDKVISTLSLPSLKCVVSITWN
jgi:hypothetical protein